MLGKLTIREKQKPNVEIFSLKYQVNKKQRKWLKY